MYACLLFSPRVVGLLNLYLYAVWLRPVWPVLIWVINIFFITPILLKVQVSRSIGDVYLKKPEFNRDPIFQQFGNPVPLKRPVMTAEPSILTRELKPQDLFLIFASDGLWEQLTDEAAVEIVFKNPRAVSCKQTPISFQLSKIANKTPNTSNISFSFSGNCKEISESRPPRGSKEAGDEIRRHKEDRKGDSASLPWRHNCYRRLPRPPQKLTYRAGEERHCRVHECTRWHLLSKLKLWGRGKTWQQHVLKDWIDLRGKLMIHTEIRRRNGR